MAVLTCGNYVIRTTVTGETEKLWSMINTFPEQSTGRMENFDGFLLFKMNLSSRDKCDELRLLRKQLKEYQTLYPDAPFNHQQEEVDLLREQRERYQIHDAAESAKELHYTRAQRQELLVNGNSPPGNSLNKKRKKGCNTCG